MCGLLGFVLLLLAHQAHGYSYLMVLHTASKSHHTVGAALSKGLLAAGHEVTLISAFPQTKPLEKLIDVNTPNTINAMAKHKTRILDNAQLSVVQRYPRIHRMGLDLAEDLAVQELLKEQRSYDAVIVEAFMNDAHYGFAEHFGDAPLIALSTLGATGWTSDLVGTPSPPSYVPHSLLQFSDRMDFGQRAQNLGFHIFEYFYQRWFHLPRQEALYRQYFPNNTQDFYEMRRSTSLVLLNNHMSISAARPYAPNMIEVGGMHIDRRDRQPLPQDIEEFIQGSQHGVIYFSLGSSLNSKDLPRGKRRAIVETLRGLKQRILWKFEDEHLPDKPANVFISSWFPQADILAHDKVIAFITHGGLLSTTESIYHGKPVLGIPFFGDQFMNMANAESAGFGLTLAYHQLTANRFRAAIERITSDSSYTEQARAMSSRFRDQLVAPLERAVFWVEHVTRHKGARYLRSACQDLSLVEYHNLDVLGTLLAGLGVVMGLCFTLIRFLVVNVWDGKRKEKMH
ncbi:UDP-glucuronosyltransferase 2A3 [Drosophila madeirensis]|uniref:UDP-glucuronosyltransferase n=1 Tax=Drosophila madeirensis TaxID=30013 RepID=A0AAU9F804_DROMD